MSLATIRAAAYDLLQVSAPTAADDVTTLALLNQARLWAEKNHDFNLTKTVAYLTVTAETGSSLATAQAGYSGSAPSGAVVPIKKVRKIKTRDTTQNVWVRGEYMSLDLYESLQYRQDRAVPYGGYPSDYEETMVILPETRNLVYHDGDTVYVPGDENVDVQLRVYKWLASYATIGATDDFLITYGEDFLMWYVVAMFNHKKGTFVPRNEGSIGPESPFAQLDRAWQALVLWDTYSTDPANTILS